MGEQTFFSPYLDYKRPVEEQAKGALEYLFAHLAFYIPQEFVLPVTIELEFEQEIWDSRFVATVKGELQEKGEA